MAYRREYYPSDTIKIVNQSEGFLVRARQKTTASAVGEPGKRNAHAISRHLLSGAPGAGVFDSNSGKWQPKGVSEDGFRDRFVNSPTYDDGSPRFSSVWLGKGDMAILLCELLNSGVGQEALGAMDRGVKRVAIHYLNEGKLAKLFGGLAKVGMKYSSVTVTPESYVNELRTFNTSKGPIQKTLKRKVPESRVANASAANIAAVHAVLDASSAGLHMQTLFPSHEASPSSSSWRIGSVVVTVVIGSNGKPLVHTQPAA